MAGISPYLRNALLNAVLRNAPYTSPTSVYMGLWTGDPTASGVEIPVTRKVVTFTLSGSYETNNSPVSFPNMPATQVAYIGIHDALTAGNLLFFGSLATPTPTAAGDTFYVGNLNLGITML